MTWFQVEFDGGLPQGLCTLCSESAIAAINFRQLCKESNNQWKQVTSIVDNIAPPSKEDATYYIFYNTDDGSNPTVKVVKKRPTTAEPLLLVEMKPAKMARLLSSMQCPDCGKQFPSPFHLNSHLKNSVKRACDLCGLLFDKPKFPQHLHKAHNKIVYPCNPCHQIFEDELSLDLHLLKAHGKNSHECKVCGKGFSNERALTAHSYCHSLFLCTSCGRTFENRNCYMYHRHQCQPETPSSETNEYICDVCGNSYTKKPSLRIHIIQKHLNVLPYVCETCGKRTSTIAHLRSHEKVHTLHRRTFNCHCGAVMRTELGYQLHLRNHTGEKPYECDECGDKFLSASRRLDHIKRRHRSTKDMPHGCKECSARFVRPFELRKHYLSVHHIVMKNDTKRN